MRPIGSFETSVIEYSPSTLRNIQEERWCHKHRDVSLKSSCGWWWCCLWADSVTGNFNICVCICRALLLWEGARMHIQGVPEGMRQTSGGGVFLILKCTDITQNTYIQSWTVTEIMAGEKCALLAVPHTVTVKLTRSRTLCMSLRVECNAIQYCWLFMCHVKCLEP
jgi:hypothetical protein